MFVVYLDKIISRVNYFLEIQKNHHVSVPFLHGCYLEGLLKDQGSPAVYPSSLASFCVILQNIFIECVIGGSGFFRSTEIR